MVQIHCSVKEHSLTLPSSANRMSQFNNHYNFPHLGTIKGYWIVLFQVVLQQRYNN